MRSTRRGAGLASFRTIRWARTRTGWRLSGCPSAVVTSAPAGYAEHCAGHVGCGLGEEEDDRLGNLLGGARAAGRHHWRQPIDSPGFAGSRMDLGQDNATGDGVDPHALAGDL